MTGHPLNVRVHEGLLDRAWIRDIRGALGVRATVEYVDLWRRLRSVILSSEPDVIRWRWSDSGAYTAASCYRALFHGSIPDPDWRLTWKGWAPLNVKIFLWLAKQDRCWTAERLAKRGMAHPPCCVLCDQEPKDTHHLLVGCVFSRTVWYRILAWCKFTIHPPDGQATLYAWWRATLAESPPHASGKAFRQSPPWLLGPYGSIATPSSSIIGNPPLMT